MRGAIKWLAIYVARAALVGVLPLLYAIEPFLNIRIGNLREDRIGHLASNTDLYARTMSDRIGRKRRKVFFIVWNPANRQLLEMWKRYLPIIENVWLKRTYMACLPVLKRTRFFEVLPEISVEEPPAFLERSPVLRFTDVEHERGRRELAKMGIGVNDWYVCFHARDPAYMGTRIGFGAATYKPSYLDCSIDNYIAAMKWIVARGGFAVRVGATVEKPLPEIGPRIVDYATRFRSDFMDVYLNAHCRFFVGNNSGLFSIPRIFNVPWALANLCPYPWNGKGGFRNLDIPKLLRHKSDGRILTFPELRDMGLLECYRDDLDLLRYLFNGATYEKLGLEWVENDPEDILGLTMDMMDMIEGRAPPPEAVLLQRAFRALYARAYIGPLAGGIGPRFALRHRLLIVPSSPECPAGSTQPHELREAR